ncbi:GTP cyclohydrolase I, partial [Hymenobacter glacialis]|uniref:GTP cyclohydrolase I n=1 Tax=Hymenobacter glacialis TaxID=1908236 RepID=UPI000AF89BE4
MDNPSGPDPAPDAHLPAELRTPLRDNAFAESDEAKITAISGHFEAIMRELGLDLTDDSLAGTPRRVAKMYVQEWFKGLDPKNRPE